jgi:tRNA A-37 threonylcarbamoyl transferase component Bud32
MKCPSCQAENDASARICLACGEALAALFGLRTGAAFASRYENLGFLGRERRFRSEIRLARRVRHRNVCSVYGDGVDGGLLYICMELVEGENLARRIRRSGALPPEEAWDAVRQVADGLRAIHQAGIVHRDLKTGNLMMDAEGVVRVMDFGIAKHHVPGPEAGTVTVSSALVGTPEYMSREQLRGEPVDFRSDLYAFGVVVYELFTGTLPFRGLTPVATILRQLHDPPILDRRQLPPSLRPVVARALAKEASGRPPSAAEMRQELHRARLASLPEQGAAPSLTERGADRSAATRPLAPLPAQPRGAPRPHRVRRDRSGRPRRPPPGGERRPVTGRPPGESGRCASPRGRRSLSLVPRGVASRRRHCRSLRASGGCRRPGERGTHGGHEPDLRSRRGRRAAAPCLRRGRVLSEVGAASQAGEEGLDHGHLRRHRKRGCHRHPSRKRASAVSRPSSSRSAAGSSSRVGRTAFR